MLLQRFRGTLDHWNPEFVEQLAGRHRVITLDMPGAGGSSGSPKASISAMDADAAAVIAALELGTVDVLGWSMGGMVAQALAILPPEIVRRTVFAGTCPPGNPRLATAPDSWSQVALKPSYDFEDIVALFYTPKAKPAERLPPPPRSGSLPKPNEWPRLGPMRSRPKLAP